MAFGIEIIVILGFLSVSPIYYLYLFGKTAYLSPEVDNTVQSLPIVCYFGMSSSWPNNGTLHPALQNASLCTHIIYISTTVKDGEITVDQEDVEKYFNKIPLLRKQNPNLKMLVSNGGGGGTLMGQILISDHNRTRYAQSIIPFLKKYDFDGVDLDWEFPGWQRPIGQRANFTMLVQELRVVFDNEAKSSGKRYILSAAVAAGRSVMVIYDVKKLAKALDFINLMVYDMHAYSTLDCITDYNSPVYPTDWEKHIEITSGNVGWSSYEWHKRGMPKSKIIVGLPTYGHGWTLMNPEYHGEYAPAKGPGRECDWCGYPWTCGFIKSGATVVWDDDAAVPYAYKGDQWLSYENVRSMEVKAQWIKDNGFGGVMVFAIDIDDYNGVCNQGKFPLISAINRVLNKRN